jgi:hypothetical protein
MMETHTKPDSSKKAPIEAIVILSLLAHALIFIYPKCFPT